MTGALYNELDPFAAQWLRNLSSAGNIAPGDVDDRSIADIRPVDLLGRAQCHFFAGIGVWSYALRLAGVPDDLEVWTGSCPCQPFSSAGKGGGFDDARHLWPTWFALIRECRPAIIFGEQVASPDGLKWLDVVHADLEGAGYAVGAADLCAAGVGAPHIRQRLYFVAYASGQRLEGLGVQLQPGQSRSASAEASRCGTARELADNAIDRRQQGIALGSRSGDRAESNNGRNRPANDDQARALADAELHDGTGRIAESHGRPTIEPDRHGAPRALADTDEPDAIDGLESRGRRLVQPEAHATSGFWADAEWIPCRDGKFRPVEPGTFPLAHGAARRVGRLRGYGNAINAEVAATFIRAALGAA